MRVDALRWYGVPYKLVSDPNIITREREINKFLDPKSDIYVVIYGKRREAAISIWIQRSVAAPLFGFGSQMLNKLMKTWPWND